MPARVHEKDIPTPEELSEIFSKVTGDEEKLDARDRLLLTVWEERVREGILARSVSPTTEPHRWRLPDERRSETHRLEIPNASIHARQVTCPECNACFEFKDEEGNEFEGYLTMGMYPDNRLGELFLTMAKQGSFVSGIMDGFVTTISIGLQHGIPLQTFVNKFKYVAFEPSGMMTSAPPELRGFHRSLLDYLFKYLEWKFPKGELRGDTVEPAVLPVLVPPLPQSEPATSPAEASTGDASEGAASDGAASEGNVSIMTSVKEES